jgi:hypothetical protein
MHCFAYTQQIEKFLFPTGSASAFRLPSLRGNAAALRLPSPEGGCKLFLITDCYFIPPLPLPTGGGEFFS